MKRSPEPKSLRAALKAAAKISPPAKTAPKAAPKPTISTIAEDDAGLWQHITSNIRPLKGRAKKRIPIAPMIDPPAPSPRAPEPRLKSVAIGDNVPPRPAVSVTPALEPGIAAGIDRNTFQKFRSGQMSIDGTLDLHGMTQPEAHDALIRYIGASYRMGRRCLIVVTGKGQRSADADNFLHGGRGVLQRAVPKWLNQLDLRPMILAIAHAQPKHGGAGALYVLLRRQRI